MFSRFFGRILAASILFIGLAAQPAVAQDLSPHLGPVAVAVESGRDGPWEVGPASGWAMFTNTTDPNSARSYYVTDPQLTGASYTLRVNTAMQPAGADIAYGGILLDRNDAGDYFGLAIGAGGEVAMLFNDADGLRVVQVEETIRAKMDGSDILTVMVAPGRADLLINGEAVFTITDTNNVGFAPSVGILVVGTGRFAFNDYEIEITSAGGGTPFPPPAGGGGTPFPPPADGGDSPFPPPADDGETRAPGPTPGTAGGEASPEDIYASQVVLGVSLGVFFHELSHAVIGELNVPATGPEEDVADGFSAFILSSGVSEADTPENAEFFEAVVKYSSLLWYYNGLEMEQTGARAPWQGEHAPSLKRFRNSFCIIYGSDPERFADLADRVGLEERTRGRCVDEYTKRYAAWETILAPVSRNLGPDAPGDLPANAPGGRVIVEFVEPRGEFGQAVVQLLRDTGAMQDIAGALEQTFVWPRDLRIQFRDCEDVNAWYDPQAGSITMCYQVVEAFSKVVFEGEAGAQAPGGGQGDPTAADAIAFLVGTWSATIQSAEGQTVMTATYTADLNYRVDMQLPIGRVSVTGTWSAEPIGNGGLRVSSVPTSWSPRQFCDASGNCQPVQFGPTQGDAAIVDPNTVNVEGTLWRRTQ